MRIKEEIRRSGLFWLPSDPERKLPGTLVITDGGNIDLEVRGLFDESDEGINKLINSIEWKVERISGHIEEYGSVTLDDCFEPPRDLRRLQHLRRWSHEEIKQIFP